MAWCTAWYDYGLYKFVYLKYNIMPTIEERIRTEIVNVRAEHLPKIRILRSHLQDVKEKINDLKMI